jgi:hypothetical protein
MTKPLVRLVAGTTAGLALSCLTGGVAHAEETPIWIAPGVDAGPVLDPTVQLPTQVLKPVFGITAPNGGLAQQDDPAVVDEPDTSGLHNKWTFAPAGVPVFGVVDSVTGIPDRLLP